MRGVFGPRSVFRPAAFLFSRSFKDFGFGFFLIVVGPIEFAVSFFETVASIATSHSIICFYFVKVLFFWVEKVFFYGFFGGAATGAGAGEILPSGL